ncbi:hypothetical protein PSQ40_11730 [Curvibacter sp. HBC61]|uniref:Uncharacterized protein n=1 Tax=Curvibacter cyanobacteriorum TaxID=3026422 RepID=A0ABT5MZ03_9BURK|nr:hypothetical protein [Curvibacter sp. HBC61]MDD0839245.1 hypothetical protein [Curvibacter sp. HBC61]
MGPVDLFYHLLGFVAPAAAVAAWLVLMGLMLGRQNALAIPWYGKFAINFLVGVVALGFSALLLGRDGKMLGYGVLLLACATSQWYLGRGWRA